MVARRSKANSYRAHQRPSIGQGRCQIVWATQSAGPERLGELWPEPIGSRLSQPCLSALLVCLFVLFALSAGRLWDWFV